MAVKDLQASVERFRVLCQQDARVVAAFVGGSMATATADEYSDLDLYLITADEEYAVFFDERMTFMRQLGDPVFLADFSGFGFDMVLFIFEDGVKGELGLAKASHFLHIHGGPYRVLVDKAGLLNGVSFPLDRVPVEEQRGCLERLIQSFWRYLFLFTGELARGRVLTSAEYLDGMRRQLVQVCRLAVDFADSGGHPPADALLPRLMVASLGRTFPHLEREEMAAAAQQAIGLFQQVARPLAQGHGVSYPEALERLVLRRFEASLLGV